MWTTTFELTPDELARPHHDLVFEGLDTFCNVYLVRNTTSHAQSRCLHRLLTS